MRLGRDERGFVLITAMLVLVIFMLLAGGIVALADVQTGQTGHERSGEAAFNLADSALQVEAKQLQLDWPDSTPQSQCSSTSAEPPQGCGDLTTTLTQDMQAASLGPDYSGASWRVNVFDDGDTSPADYAAHGALGYDENRDNRVWVSATATTPNGQERTVAEQVTRRIETISLPRNVLTAGGLDIENHGAPAIITTTDGSGDTSQVGLRCETDDTSSDCVLPKSTEVDPSSAYEPDADPGASALTPSEVQSFVAQAQAAGTLYPGCPPSDSSTDPTPPPGETSPVVVIESTGASGCTLSGNWFSTKPGAMVVLQGSVSLGGSTQFSGLLYMVNQDGVMPSPGPACTSDQLSSAPTLVSITGNAQIDGAVFVDGCGVVFIQDEGGNPALAFSPSALQTLHSYGSTTAVPDTFRVVTQ